MDTTEIRLVPMTRRERDNLYALGQVVIALNWDAAQATGCVTDCEHVPVGLCNECMKPANG